MARNTSPKQQSPAERRVKHMKDMCAWTITRMVQAHRQSFHECEDAIRGVYLIPTVARRAWHHYEVHESQIMSTVGIKDPA